MSARDDYPALFDLGLLAHRDDLVKQCSRALHEIDRLRGRVTELDAEVNHWVAMSNADWDHFSQSPVRE